MVLVFLVLLVFSILGDFAKTEQVECRVHKAQIDPRLAKFAPNQFYALKVCVTLKWPTQNCSRASESAVEFTLRFGTRSVSIPTRFTPMEVQGRFCHIYDPCEVAKAGQKVVENSGQMDAIQMSASAEVYAFDKDPDPKSKSLDIQITGDLQVLIPGFDETLEHELLSVICPFQNCTVQSEGYRGDNIYYLGYEVGKSQCVDKGKHRYSVATFLCDPKCKRKYIASTSSVDAPPRPKPLPGLPPPTTGDTGTKGLPPPPTGDTGTKDTVPPEKKPDTKAPATKAPKAPAAAATTKKSNAVLHLGIRTIFTVAVLALLA